MKCEQCGGAILEKHHIHDKCYCSSECAIGAIMDDILTNIKELATETYNDTVIIEAVAPAETITVCKHCGRPLALNETAWSSRDGMYCSHSCGIADAYSKYELSEGKDANELFKNATAYFADVAEEISREDYGAKIALHAEYAMELDKTFIFEEISENGTVISRTLTGYTIGDCTNYETEIEKYDGWLKHILVD